jgi:hypothetical protein
MAMSDLQSAVAGQREIADALQGLVAELETRTVPADLRRLAGGLAANSTRATLNALNTRGAADAIAAVAVLLEGVAK